MVSLSRANPFPTLTQAAAPFQAAATTGTQAPAPTQGTPVGAGQPYTPDPMVRLMKMLQSLMALLSAMLGGQSPGTPPNDHMEKFPTIAPDAARTAKPAAGGHWGVVHTCKSGWITDDVKQLTRYGYNPLRQNVGVPYDQAVSMWERDSGRKFPGLQR